LTIRKQWLLVLTLTAVLAVFVNTLIIDISINKYFLTFNSETYDYHVSQIEQLAESALQDGSLTNRQLSVQFESHLDDPIISIKLYDIDGNLIASAENTDETGYGYGMMNEMMQRMKYNTSAEVDTFDVSAGSTVIGVLNITRYSSLDNSLISTQFKYALLRNSFFSFLLVLIMLILIGIVVSRKLSRDLKNTAAQALSIDVGDRPDFNLSHVKEIRIIQTRLDLLQSRLKLKQTARKRTVDEFVHQTRTPLTILRTHLEGLEDGVVTMTDNEIKICQSQIDSIADIISNMHSLLDVDKPAESAQLEEFDVHMLLKQITNGMKAQFEKKKVLLRLLDGQKAVIRTDKYKLSQIIYNLLSNAYKFTGAGGTVDISYEISYNQIVIHVKDTGVGISEDDLPNLFDAYFRGSNADKTTGDGLGLYVVKENIEQIGGTIQVKSAQGAGSDFIITIPVS
jgi:signal transduction histidine kinase